MSFRSLSTWYVQNLKEKIAVIALTTFFFCLTSKSDPYLQPLAFFEKNTTGIIMRLNKFSLHYTLIYVTQRK